jgi:hypothetical protein
MQTITDALELFYSTHLVSAEALFHELFQLQTDLLIQLFKIDTINHFWQTLRLIRLTTNANGLATPPGPWESKNFVKYVYRNDLIATLRPTATIKRTGNQSCSCVTDFECYHLNDFLKNGDVMPVGCHLIETFLFFNLTCFFNSSCIKNFTSLTTDAIRPRPLNSSHGRTMA